MIRITGVQVVGLGRVRKLSDRTIRYLTAVTGEGVVQIELCADEWIGDTDEQLRKKLEVKIEDDTLPQSAAPKHDEGDGA